MSEYLKNIDKYLNNEMTSEEVIEFRKEVAENSALAEELKLQEDMRAAFSKDQWFSSSNVNTASKQGDALLSYLKSDEANTLKTKIGAVVKTQGSSKNASKFWLLSSAAAIVILLVTYYFLFLTPKPSYQELYIQNIALEELPSLVSRGENNDNLVKGQLAFEEANYLQAINHFKTYFQTDSDNPVGHLYLGLAYLETGSYSKALNELDKLAVSNTLESKSADWYKAMIYLKMERENELIETLTKIASDTDNFKSEKAKTLLRAFK